jgi:hypothetical protein
MPRIRSSIPTDAEERPLSDYKEASGAIHYRTTECWHAGQVVGRRCYRAAGQLIMETPLRDGVKHGREYTWDDEGWLLLIEPYAHGQIHGTARQYDRQGRVIGTYRCVHGTGYDIWRSSIGDEPPHVSEIRGLRNGKHHGYEWWVNADERSVYHETHFRDGREHGIERRWNERGRLSRGYPRYWIDGQRVTRRQYLRAARQDATLPPWNAADNAPQRRFPAEVVAQLRRTR